MQRLDSWSPSPERQGEGFPKQGCAPRCVGGATVAKHKDVRRVVSPDVDPQYMPICRIVESADVLTLKGATECMAHLICTSRSEQERWGPPLAAQACKCLCETSVNIEQRV